MRTLEGACGGLDKNVPYRLMHLNAKSQGMELFERIRMIKRRDLVRRSVSLGALRFQKPLPNP